MAEQTGRIGKCTNFGNCTLADSGADQKIPDGAAPVCTECGRGLMLSQPDKDRSKLIGGILALVVLAGRRATGDETPVGLSAARGRIDPPGARRPDATAAANRGGRAPTASRRRARDTETPPSRRGG